MSDKSCAYAFVAAHIRPNGDVLPCCVYDFSLPLGNINTESLETVWNSKKWNNLRDEMISGNDPEGCKRCVYREKHNLDSNRKHANNRYSKELDDKIRLYKENKLNFEILDWDFRTTNLCNLKCQTCYSGLSSMWNDNVEITINDNADLDLKKVIDDNINVVKRVYFAGGEPLISDLHYYIIEKLIKNNRKDVSLSYSTNLTKLDYKGIDFIDLWNQFDTKPAINVSIDGIGKINDTIRTGSKFDKIIYNLQRLIQETNCKVIVCPCISILNVEYIPDIFYYIKDLSNDIHLNFSNVLNNPEKLALHNLTVDKKNKIITKFEMHLNKNIMLDKELKKFIKILQST